MNVSKTTTKTTTATAKLTTSSSTQSAGKSINPIVLFILERNPGILANFNEIKKEGFYFLAKFEQFTTTFYWFKAFPFNSLS